MGRTGEGFWRRGLRPLLFLYPAPFRETYGDEMLRLADEWCTRAQAERGRAAALRCAARVATDLAWNGVIERMHGSRSNRAPEPRAGGRMTLHIRSNLRDAARSLRRAPGFAATIILTLAVGTGATLALFSIVDAALLRPLPYPEAERLFSLAQRDARFGLTPFAPPYLHDLRERVDSFDIVAGFSPSWTMALTGSGEPRIVTAAYVSDRLFDLLGVEPVRGRLFRPHEYARGGDRIAVLSESFWDRAFGAATPLRGQTIRLDGVPHEVVGILPAAFRLPIKDSAVSQAPSAGLWLPFALNPYAELRMVPVMNVIGRLRPGLDADAARAEVQAVGRTLARDFPEHSRWLETTAVPLRELVTREARSAVWPLFGAAALLLVIACANVANLLLARGASRRRELAVRASLGATRARIVAQLLTESLVLAALGCALGLLLAGWGLAALPALGLEGLPPSADIRLDGRVVGFALLLAGVTSVAFGLLPALRASGEGGSDSLKAGARVAGGGATRLRRGLVAAQTALALALLTGAGLLARSFVELTRVDPGFRADGVLAVPVDLGRRDAPGRRVFLDQLFERLRHLPGVTAVSAVNRTPLSGSNVLVGVEIEGDPVTAREPVPMDRRVVAPEYFQTLHIPLGAGRDFGAMDRPEGTDRVAIVNEAARRFWSDGRAVGRRLRLMLQSGPGPWLTVVGVSGNVLHEGLDRAARPEVYVPYAQAAVESMVALLRTAGDPSAVAAAAKTQVWALDRDLPLDGVRPLTAVLADAVGEPRFRMLLLNAFAVMALLLAALGIYGMTAYTVARRTRDIGVRMALGARRSHVLRLVLSDGLTPAVWGCAVGLLAAFGLTRALRSLLFGVAPFDAVTYMMAAAVLVLAAVVAAYVPARRAVRIDPVTALRME